VYVDNAFTDRRASSVDRVITSRPCRERFGEQSRRRVLGRSLSSRRTLFRVCDLRHVVVDISSNGNRPSDVRSYQTSFLCHAPESFSFQGLRKPIPLASLRFRGCLKYPV